MKIKLFALLCALPLIASDPPGFIIWSASDLKGMEKKLAGKLEGKPFASQQLDQFGNHHAMVALRDGNGEAEYHATEADLFVVQMGTAKLVVGGKVVNPRTTAPNEIRGPSISGGEEKTISAGDIVHVPAKIPHQVMASSGKFSYFVLKVAGQ